MKKDVCLLIYDTEVNKAKCSCYTKIKVPYISQIVVNKDQLYSNFKNISNIANFKMLIFFIYSLIKTIFLKIQLII